MLKSQPSFLQYQLFRDAIQITQPDIGWLKTIRVSLGMSLQQVANKLSITKQNIQEMETREKEGCITLNSLKKRQMR